MTQLRDDAIAAYCAELHDLEDEVEAAQEEKKKFFESARDAHGRKFVAALKLAIKTARMDPDKRLQVEEIDAEAERILGIMRQGLHVARGARTSAREIIDEIPPHDADGVIIEDEHEQPETADEKDDGSRGAELVLDEGASSESEMGKSIGTDQRPAERSGEDQTDAVTPQRLVIEDASPSSSEPPAGAPAGEAVPAVSPVSNVTPIRKKQPAFEDDPHPECRKPDFCGGFSMLGLCQDCRAHGEAASA